MRLHASAQALAASLLLAAAALGQNTFYVPDNNPGTGIPNLVPFGDSDPLDPKFGNQKYQTLVTAAQLGTTQRTIAELGFVPIATGLRQFATIKVQMANTTATTLGTNFAANLGGSATTVLQATGFQWPNRPYVWYRLGLTTSFLFDGTSNVVVDIEVTGAGMPGASTVPAFLRENNVPRAFAFGWTGSPPADGVVDQNGLKIELGASGLVDFGTFGLACMGSNGLLPTLGYNVTTNSGRVGQNLVVTLTNAFASTTLPSGALLFTGSSNRFAYSGTVPLPLAMDPAGAPGCNLYIDPQLNTFSPVSATGTASLTQGIPNDTAYIGARVFHQFAVVDGTANPLGLTFTNYGRVLIGL